jgi:hypothetical protein
MNLFLEGNKLVFAQMGRQVELSEDMIEIIDEDKAVKFRLKDEDGPFNISVVLRAP